MVAHTFTVALQGLECIMVDVQVMLAGGMPGFTIVGLPNKIVGESKDRIKAALFSLGKTLPAKKIIVNLSPADILKTGNHYDLPIALGLLAELGAIRGNLSDFVAVGELSLDGGVVSTPSVLAAAIKAQQKNIGLICPKENYQEAMWAANNLNRIIAAGNLAEIVDAIKDNSYPEVHATPSREAFQEEYGDLQEVKGQRAATRALEVAAAGRHNLLMIGPPGVGKSMLASRIRSIMPGPSEQEILEINLILAAQNKLNNGICKTIPLRAPHHSISPQAMVGGGRNASPGEVTMAHNGVLFLDEFPEFSAAAINTLRQPLETKQVSISRVENQATYPADFQLIAAMNPCKCGYLFTKDKRCKKAPRCAEEYLGKIHNPILERIDMCVVLNPVDPASLMGENPRSISSAEIKKNVIKARDMQAERYKNLPYKHNSMVQKDIEKTICICEKSFAEINKLITQCSLSFRGYHKLLRVARSIADIENSEKVALIHVKEALAYRMHNNGSR